MIQDQPRPNWAPIPRAGCKNVEHRVLLNRENIVIAHLKFNENATIDEHSAPIDIDVICLSGSGYVSIGEDRFSFKSGQTIGWPKNVVHRLWTKNNPMETIMVERHAS